MVCVCVRVSVCFSFWCTSSDDVTDFRLAGIDTDILHLVNSLSLTQLCSLQALRQALLLLLPHSRDRIIWWLGLVGVAREVVGKESVGVCGITTPFFDPCLQGLHLVGCLLLLYRSLMMIVPHPSPPRA